MRLPDGPPAGSQYRGSIVEEAAVQMDDAMRHQLADELLASLDRRRITARPTSLGAFDLEDAYDVLDRLTALRRRRGERPVGWKIGFTNAALWPAYGVDRPLWAPVYNTTVTQSLFGTADLATGELVAPRIEPEIVFGLGASIRAARPDPADEEAVLSEIIWMALGFEIVDCHYPNWQFTSAECAADFGLHARLIIGPKHYLQHGRRSRMSRMLRECTLELTRDGNVIDRGVGTNVLGSPLRALGFLIDALARQGGEGLREGDVVTTGTLTAAYPIAAGQIWRSSVDQLPLASLRLTTM